MSKHSWVTIIFYISRKCSVEVSPSRGCCSHSSLSSNSGFAQLFLDLATSGGRAGSLSECKGKLFIVRFTIYTLHCTIYSEQLYTVHCKMYTVHCTLYTVALWWGSNLDISTNGRRDLDHYGLLLRKLISKTFLSYTKEKYKII